MADVEDYSTRSLDCARRQRALSWKLRTGASLARLWNHQSRVSEARDLLAPIYAHFTDGFATADLREARSLLEQLG